jgi:hypothetical protein
MSRDGAIIFGDLVGKLDMLHVFGQTLLHVGVSSAGDEFAPPS